MGIWVIVFKNGPYKICGRQPLKNLNPYLKPSKSYLIVKEKNRENAIETFKGKEVKITKGVKRHLRAVTRNEAHKKSITRLLVDEWVERLSILSEIAESGPPKCQGSYRKTNFLYEKNSKFKDVRYDYLTHGSAHLFMIAISSYSHKERK